MAWDDVQTSSDSISFGEWNLMVPYIKSVIDSSGVISSDATFEDASITATALGLGTTDSPTFAGLTTPGNINVDSNGVLYLDNTNNNNTVSIRNSGTNAKTLEIDSTNFDISSDGIVTINQDFNTNALVIDSEATSNPAIEFDVGATKSFGRFGNPNDPSGTFYMYRNVDSTGTQAPMVFMKQDHASDDQNVLKIQQDSNGVGVNVLNAGTGVGVFIDENGDGFGLSIDSEATTSTNYGLQVITGQGADVALLQSTSTDYYLKRTGASATGSNHFYRNIASTGTAAPVMFIEQDHASDDQPALSIQNDGTGYGLSIDQNGNGTSFKIDSEATTAPAVTIDIVDGDAHLRLVGDSGNATPTEGDLWRESTGLMYYDGTTEHNLIGFMTDVVDDTTPTLGGNLDASDNNINGLGSVGFTQELDNGSKTTHFSVDFGTDQKQKVTLTANTMTLTLDTTFDRVGNYVLKIVNGGLATLTWASESGSVYWAGGTAPTLTSSGTDIVSFYYDGTNWYGVASLAFA